MTDEYNTVLFSWYFKSFELLRWYLVKHPSGVDLEKLDLEEVNQEMAADEAAQSSTTEIDAPETAPENAPASDAPTGDDVAIDARTRHLWRISLFFFFFFGCPFCFGFFVNLISKQFPFNLSREQYN